MEIASIIDQELAPPNGNRKGLSYGQLAVLFLTYAEHRSTQALSSMELYLETQNISFPKNVKLFIYAP